MLEDRKMLRTLSDALLGDDIKVTHDKDKGKMKKGDKATYKRSHALNMLLRSDSLSLVDKNDFIDDVDVNKFLKKASKKEIYKLLSKRISAFLSKFFEDDVNVEIKSKRKDKDVDDTEK